MAYDVHGQNRHTPRELLDAGGQLALKRDISSPDEVLKIAGQIAALFGFDLNNWQDMFDFDDLRAAIAGEYVGTDPALNAIQTVVGTIRRFAIGIIEPWRLPLIPLSHIGEANPNLLENGSFDGPNPIEETEGWSLDTGVGRTSPGSARTYGNGTRRVLLSNAVLCSPDQKFDVGGFLTWSMLTGGGTEAFKLSVVAYDSTESVVQEVVIAQVNSPSAAQAWTGLLGQYTVPANTVKIRVQVEVAATVTGGTINWDDLSVTKYGNLPQRMVAGLVTALGDLGAGIAAAVEAVGNFFDKLTGKIGTTIADLQSWAAQLKTILGGGTVGAGIFPTLSEGLKGLANGARDFAQQILDAIVKAIRGIPIVGAGIADLLSDVQGLRTTADTANATAITADTKAITAQSTANQTAQAVVDGWAGTGASTGEVYDTLAAIRTAVANGYTVETITSTRDWIKPAGITELYVTAIGSGQTGQAATSPNPGNGGLGGGFTTFAFDPAQVANTVRVTVGLNGAQSSFGTYFATILGEGHMATQFGFAASTSIGGRGGKGGMGFYVVGSDIYQPTVGLPGESTPIAPGGAGATTKGATGSPGGNADLNAVTKCGGGGGGGGAGNGQAPIGGRARGGQGGPGGFPAGGGGGGGGGDGINNIDGPGGIGGGGVVFIFYK